MGKCKENHLEIWRLNGSYKRWILKGDSLQRIWVGCVYFGFDGKSVFLCESHHSLLKSNDSVDLRSLFSME